MPIIIKKSRLGLGRGKISRYTECMKCHTAMIFPKGQKVNQDGTKCPNCKTAGRFMWRSLGFERLANALVAKFNKRKGVNKG